MTKWNLFTPTVRRVRVFGHSGGMLILWSPAQSRVEPPPRVYCLPAPDPEAGSDAHNEAHKVLQHKHRIIWRHVFFGTWTVMAALPS